MANKGNIMDQLKEALGITQPKVKVVIPKPKKAKRKRRPSKPKPQRTHYEISVTIKGDDRDWKIWCGEKDKTISTAEYIVKNMGKKKVLWSDDSINLGYTGSHGFHTYIDVLSLLSVVGVTVTEIYYEVKWQRYYYSGFGTLGGEYSWKQIPFV